MGFGPHREVLGGKSPSNSGVLQDDRAGVVTGAIVFTLGELHQSMDVPYKYHIYERAA